MTVKTESGPTQDSVESLSIEAGRLEFRGGKVPVWAFFVIGLAVVAIVAALATMTHHGQSAKRLGVRTAIVRRTSFIRSVRLHGTVEAVQFYSVTAPRMSGPGMGSLIVTKLAKSGSHVNKGDLLVEFDRQQQTRNALDREAEYRDLIQQIQKKKADQAAALAGDQTELVQAEHAVQAATLELRKNEVVSQIDAEKNRETLEEAKATYDQLKQTFQLKRRAAAAEMKILEIQRDRASAGMKYSQANADQMSVRTPIDGIVVLNMVWKGGQWGEVKEGDEIRPGTPFMEVVNPATMQVRAPVNQADVMQLSEGQTAQIGLDAYPELKLTGKIATIAAEGNTSMSDYVRRFTVLIPIGGADTRLMPDLSASVDVDLAHRDGVLTVPRDALVWNGRSYFVVVKEGNRTANRSVRIGDMSDTEAVIESGLSDGAVVLRNPKSQGARL